MQEALQNQGALLGAMPKNSHEEIRLYRKAFRGRDLLDLRVWYSTTEGELRPSPKGITFHPDLLPGVLDLLQSALPDYAFEE